MPALENREQLNEQLRRIHQRIQKLYPFISCIEVSLLPTARDPLRLHACTDTESSPVSISSLLSFNLRQREPEVIQDLPSLLKEGERREDGGTLLSGFKVPIMVDDQVSGFTLFAAREKHCFTPGVIEQMHVYARVIAQIVTGETDSRNGLQSSISAILKLNSVNRSESPQHLKRVAKYSGLIASQCAEAFQLSQEWIEHLVLFAPLHDIGKIFMPEAILMKPGKLTHNEFEQMKTHTLKGREIIDHMINSFGYKDRLHYTSLLRNIITYHHEAIDGNGYPFGLKGDDIPVEARIVAVADVLDALMTKRAYKEAWTIDKTFTELYKLAGHKLDRRFVDILAANKEELMRIRSACAE
ncbi:HD-GYP domain-containing protein [Thiolapillus sp.]